MAFDYKKFLTQSKPIALKVKEVEKHEKREGYLKVTGFLETGDETFFVASEQELSSLPVSDDNTILNLTGFCTMKKNKLGRYYVERINPLPAIGGNNGFTNPFAK